MLLSCPFSGRRKEAAKASSGRFKNGEGAGIDTRGGYGVPTGTTYLVDMGDGHTLAVHEQLIIWGGLTSIARLLQLLEVLLGMGADLHEGACLDQLGNFLPGLPVQPEAIQEEHMLFVCPSTYRFPEKRHSYIDEVGFFTKKNKREGSLPTNL